MMCLRDLSYGLGKCGLKGDLTTELHSSRSTSMTAGYIGKNQPVNQPKDVIRG